MLLEINEYFALFSTPIAVAVGEKRCAAEQRAVRALISEAFGSAACLGHNAAGAPFVEGEVSLAPVLQQPLVGILLAGEMPCISISHCRDMAVLAVSLGGASIGVDIETSNRASQLHRVATRFLSVSQIPIWGASDALLTDAWTLKEASYKTMSISGIPLIDIGLPPQPMPEKTFVNCFCGSKTLSLSLRHLPSNHTLAVVFGK